MQAQATYAPSTQSYRREQTQQTELTEREAKLFSRAERRRNLFGRPTVTAPPRGGVNIGSRRFLLPPTTDRFQTMTTHEMAKRLLELPDVTLVIEGWTTGGRELMSADMTGYDPEGTAIIWKKPQVPLGFHETPIGLYRWVIWKDGLLGADFGA